MKNKRIVELEKKVMDVEQRVHDILANLHCYVLEHPIPVYKSGDVVSVSIDSGDSIVNAIVLTDRDDYGLYDIYRTDNKKVYTGVFECDISYQHKLALDKGELV